MGISKENAKKLNFLWQDENKVMFFESFMKIVNKDTKIIPFKLTKEQKDLVNNLEKFNIVSKSRQLGISTITISLSLRECIVNPNSNCLLVSYDQKSCNAIFNKLKQQYNLLPKWLRPDTIANNRQELKFTNGSKITCVTAGNKDLGRGDTLQIVHLSEFAFMKNPEKQLNSILQALAPTGILIIESTSNGLNYYSELVTAAENKENDFKLFFYNWINGGSLFEKDYKDAVRRFKKRNGTDIITDFDDEEEELIKLGATMEQLIWRRLKISNTSLEQFHQEYPSTLMESFITTGNNVFDNGKIAKTEKAILTENIKLLDIKNIVGLPDRLRYLGKSLGIWNTPVYGDNYSLGVDTSDGVGQDYSVIEVLNQDGLQVAEFRDNKIAPYEFAEIVDELGRYYNNGLLVVEKNKSGNTVVEKLWKQIGYKNMYKYKKYDDRNKLRWARGFDTNSISKPMIINNLREYFETSRLCINSKIVLNEMKVYDSTLNATVGHDDTVIGMALAVEGLKYPFFGRI